MERSGRTALYAIMALCVVTFVCAESDTLALGASPFGRISYSFAHANIFHLVANIIALNAIAQSRFRLPLPHLAFAFVVAASAPADCHHVVVGASAFIYAIFGIISWQAARRARFHTIVAAFMALGFAFSSAANCVHIYCYIFGVAFGGAARYHHHRPRR